VRNRSDLIHADWIILPGSKHTSSDLNWLCEKGLDTLIQDHAIAGKPILAICGGMQMLGATLEDPFGIDGAAKGLNLLALRTIFDKEKLIKKTSIQFGDIANTWQALSNLKVSGYEIHHGKTEILETNTSALSVKEIIPNTAWLNQSGNILGVYLHGLFEDTNITRALFGSDSISLDTVFECLALHLEGNIDDAQEYLNYLIQ
jgi:adenosylcobyric acid synthase